MADIITLSVNATGAEEALATLKSIQGTINNINKKTVKVKVGQTETKKYNDALDEANKKLQTHESILNNIKKNAAWQVISASVASAIRSFTDALDTMKAVDAELVTIRKVTGATTEELEKIEKQAYKTASAYGVAADEYLSSVAQFSRAGYGDQSEALAELATKTQLVGDVNQDIANQFLISVDAAYKLNGQVSALNKVLDGANEIDNKYATSIEKIADGLGTVAPVAAQAGVGIDELTAAIGTITAVTQRSGSEAARAFRALVLNILGDTTTEIEDGATWTAGEIEGLRDVIRQYAPEAYKAAEATGSLINPMEAIAGLAQSMEDGLLTEQKLMEMVSDIGGKLRTSQLLALVQNWDMYQSMLIDYGNSVGSADREVENALDSWTVKTNILKNTLTEFISNTVNTDWIKKLLDGLTWLIKSFDSLGNVILVVGGAITALKWDKLTKSFADLGGKITKYTTDVKEYFQVWKAGGATFGEAFKAAGGVQLAISLITAAISAGIIWWNNYKQKIEETAEAAREQAAQSKEQADNFAGLYDEYVRLNSITNRTAEEETTFLGLQEKINQALADKAVQLEHVTYGTEEYTKKITELNNALAEEAAIDANAAMVATGEEVKIAYGKSFLRSTTVNKNNFTGRNREVESQVRNILSPYDLQNGAGYGALSSNADDIAAYYIALIKAQEAMEEAAIRLHDNSILESSLYKDITDGINSMSGALEKYIKERATALMYEQISQKGMPDDVSSFISFKSAVLEASGASEDMQKVLVRLMNEAFPELAAQENGAAEATNNIGESATNATGELEGLLDGLAEVEGHYKSLSDAVDEYNDNGYLSASTMQSLIESGLIEYLEQAANGTWTVSDAFYAMAEEQRQAAISSLQEAYAQDLVNLALGRTDQLSAGAKTALGLVGDASINAGEKALTAAEGFNTEARAMAAVALAQEGLTGNALFTALDAADEKLKGFYNTQLSHFNSWQLSSGSSKSKKSGSSRSKETDKILEQHKDLVSLLKSELDLMEAQGKPAEQQISKMHEIQQALHKQADYLRSIGASQEEINKLSTEWWSIQKDIEGIQQSLADELGDALSRELEKAAAARDAEIDAIDDAIDALEESRKIEEEKLTLKEKQKAVTDAEIALINAQNERTIRMYNAATDQWEWVANAQEVENAKKNLENAKQDLADYESELAYEAQIAEMEARKTAIEEAYDVLEKQMEGIVKAMEEPARSIQEVLSDIAAYGTPQMKAQINTVNGLLGELNNYIAAAVGSQTGASFTGGGGLPSGTFTGDKTDYSTLMLNAGSQAEFDYWAELRQKKIAAQGINLSASGWMTNEQLEAKWNANPSTKTYDSGGILEGIGGIKATEQDEVVLPPTLTNHMLSPISDNLFQQRMGELSYLFGTTNRMPPSISGQGVNQTQNITTNNGGQYTINGVQIGQQEAETMSLAQLVRLSKTLAIYKN